MLWVLFAASVVVVFICGARVSRTGSDWAFRIGATFVFVAFLLGGFASAEVLRGLL